MTVKELYNICKANGIENFPIKLKTFQGFDDYEDYLNESNISCEYGDLVFTIWSPAEQQWLADRMSFSDIKITQTSKYLKRN